MSKATELFEQTSARLIRIIEEGIETGDWRKPWKAIFGHGVPMNATTKKAYKGMNTVILWVERESNDYASDLWATYKQWQGIGAQVRKGESGTKLVKWGVTYRCSTCNSKGRTPCEAHPGSVDKHLWATAFTVFNADQVDGYEVPTPDTTTEPERFAAADAFMAATGADIRYKAGDRAFYNIGGDYIVLPERTQFASAPGFYGTALHELTHWTGHKSRLDREQMNAFGSVAYAAEELIAELGAAMLNANFGIESEPSIDHASYLKGWLKVLKADPKHLYRAAKEAQKSSEYLLDLAAKATTEEVAA